MQKTKRYRRAILKACVAGVLSLAGGMLQARTSAQPGLPDAAASLQKSIEAVVKNHKEEHEASEVIAMVMDPYTGEVLALASSNREDKDYVPKFASYRFEPGGLMAPFVIALALDHSEETGLTLQSDIDDGAAYHKGKYPPGSVADLLIHPSSRGYAKIAQYLDAQTLHQGLVAFGFGQKTGIGLPGEQSGILPDSRAFEDKVRKAATAAGYGVMVTPIQLLRAYSALINGGRSVTPHLAQRTVSPGPRMISPQTAKTMKKMLRENVLEGTGRHAYVAGITVGGKTGTARIGAGSPRMHRYNAGFFGYAEDANRTLAIGVLVIDPKSRWGRTAGMTAAPAFGSVVSAIYSSGVFREKKAKRSSMPGASTDQ